MFRFLGTENDGGQFLQGFAVDGHPGGFASKSFGAKDGSVALYTSAQTSNNCSVLAEVTVSPGSSSLKVAIRTETQAGQLARIDGHNCRCPMVGEVGV